MFELVLGGIEVRCHRCQWTGQPLIRMAVYWNGLTVGWVCPACHLARCAPKMKQDDSAIDTIQKIWGVVPKS